MACVLTPGFGLLFFIGLNGRTIDGDVMALDDPFMTALGDQFTKQLFSQFLLGHLGKYPA
jgi:hypothetical protein